MTSTGSYGMIASKTALDLIKKWEGFRPRAYLDVAGNATIGFGTLLHKGVITETDKKLEWGEELATNKLKVEVIIIEQALNRMIKVPVKQSEFDSLVVWTYNLGIGSAKSSSWLRELNKGNYKDVPRLMSLWNKARINGVLTESQGLKNRRKEESDLFIKQ